MCAVAKQKPPPLREMFKALYDRWGPQHWWPGRTRFEIVVGAILTQNTAWANVEKAIRRLRRERALHPDRLHATRMATLAAWIRPAGYFNVKARRLRAFTTMLQRRFNGKLDRLLGLGAEEQRRILLSVHGIGPETADSILLYAAGQPVFVVDAYTRRFLRRHGWITARAGYDEIAALFTRHLPRDARLFNEYHALIVRLGKTHCRSAPRCEGCPLQRWLPAGGPRRI